MAGGPHQHQTDSLEGNYLPSAAGYINCGRWTSLTPADLVEVNHLTKPTGDIIRVGGPHPVSQPPAVQSPRN